MQAQCVMPKLDTLRTFSYSHGGIFGERRVGVSSAALRIPPFSRVQIDAFTLSMKTNPSINSPSPPILLLIAGAKGAVGSTIAAAVAAGETDPDIIIKSLTSRNRFSADFPSMRYKMAGWDVCLEPYSAIWEKNGVLPEAIRLRYQEYAEAIPVRKPPDPTIPLKDQVEAIRLDLAVFMESHPGAWPVFVNLLPAAPCPDTAAGPKSGSCLPGCIKDCPDRAYALAAVDSGIPMVNFSPNLLESQELLATARQNRVPIAGRDGKTGQTFLKVVLASALKARAFSVEGWYSLNLLGNADGKNLMIPENASGKLANKTAVLDSILSASGERGDSGVFHKVRIDYYPPRGDAKEAWDLIDFSGLFGLPMSLRVNLLGRDSILAAPLVLDLSRWMVALKAAGRGGPVPELAFFFKTPVGETAPATFQDQLSALDLLERECMESFVLSNGRHA